MTDPSGPQFVLAGYRYGASPYVQGTHGYYWSSSAWTSATNAYVLGLYGTSSTVYPPDNGSKHVGFTLRCLAQ